MALSARTVWEVQTGGDDTFGGGFVTGATGTDYSLTAPTVAQATLTVLSLVHTTTTQVNVSLTDYTVAAGDVGNIAQLSVNGGAMQFYQITVADVANNRWTVDRSLGTAAQTVAGKMGGAFATPGYAGAVWGRAECPAVNMILYIKAGTYTLTTASVNVAGGPPQCGGSKLGLWIGYETTRGDMGAKPIVDAGAVTGITTGLLSSVSSIVVFINIKADGQGGTSNIGFVSSCYLCEAVDCPGTAGFNGASKASWFVKCKASGNVAGFSAAWVCFLCEARDNTSGFVNSAVIMCTAFDNGDNFTGSPFTGLIANSVAYSATSDGLNGCNSNAGLFNNIFYGNGVYGVDFGTALAWCLMVNNAFLSNSSGKYDVTPDFSIGEIVPSGDPFIDSTNFDFRLDATTGEGAVLKSAAIGVLNQTDANKDIGATQHADPAGGGGPIGNNFRGGFVN